MAGAPAPPAAAPAARGAAPGAAPDPFGPLAGATPRGARAGLYIHVPFCVRRCHYCAFNTAPLAPGALGRYLAALHRELDLLAALPWARRLTLGSVFFGGGTPSLLDPDALAAVLDRIRRRFALAPDAEVTVECNPESVSRDHLAAYRAAGVTRLSLGVQALDDALLAALGRLHDARGARAAFAAARAAGFDNVNVDLMYGLPGLTLETWTRTVAEVLAWAPEHLSAYALSLDPGSRWGATGVRGLPDEELVVAQYWALARRATAAGWEHYEISNYARPGRRSTHNLLYWRRGEYLAAGPGAAGFVGDLRWSTVRALGRWAACLEAGALPIETAERLTPRQVLGERLILGLRLAEGVPEASLEVRLREDPALRRRIDAWQEAGLLVRAGGRVRLTEAGFLVSDSLFVELL